METKGGGWSDQLVSEEDAALNFLSRVYGPEETKHKVYTPKHQTTRSVFHSTTPSPFVFTKHF